jgi:hypothetical protein
MALRQTPAEKKAAQEASTVPAIGNDLPAAWGTEGIAEFNSHNLTPKEDLLGVPFLIIGAEIERADGRDYDVAFVYALDIHGTEFEFNDASSGVREQVRNILIAQGLSPTPNEGYQKLTTRIVIRHGLRNSDFKVIDKESGKKVEATTWYLTGVSEKH